MSFPIRLLGLAACLVALAACQETPGPAPGTDLARTAPAEVIEIREDALIANYYPAATEAAPGPAVLMVGGSEGALSEGVARDAETLRAEGFSVLHLSFYRFEGQEQNLELVPLERFDRALDWLLAREAFHSARSKAPVR